MTGTPDAEHPGPRRSSIWPWLAMPLVALAVFFALRSCHAGMVRDSDSPARTRPGQSGQEFGEPIGGQ